MYHQNVVTWEIVQQHTISEVKPKTQPLGCS